jgi:hypothetical protein
MKKYFELLGTIRIRWTSAYITRLLMRPGEGQNSFIRALRDYLVKNGVTVRDGLDDEYKVLLLNGAYRAPGRLLDYSSIKSVKETGYAGLLSASWAGQEGQDRLPAGRPQEDLRRH